MHFRRAPRRVTSVRWSWTVVVGTPSTPCKESLSVTGLSTLVMPPAKTTVSNIRQSCCCCYFAVYLLLLVLGPKVLKLKWNNKSKFHIFQFLLLEFITWRIDKLWNSSLFGELCPISITQTSKSLNLMVPHDCVQINVKTSKLYS